MKHFILITALLTSITAHAWKETGGGDEVGLEFTRSFTTALDRLEAAGAISGPDVTQFKQTTDMVRVVVVNHDLPVQVGEAEQYSVAINDRNRMMITINRARWVKIKNQKQKEAIALHEILSLVGVESSGEYPYSEKYLALPKSSPAGAPAGFKVPTSAKPKAKTLNCRVQYDGTKNGGNLPSEVHNISQKLSQDPDPEKLMLDALVDFETKDKRFHVYLSAVQPFVTKITPNPHEFVGLNVIEEAAGRQSIAGSIGFADKDVDVADLSLTFDKTDVLIGDLTLHCTLD